MILASLIFQNRLSRGSFDEDTCPVYKNDMKIIKIVFLTKFINSYFRKQNGIGHEIKE
jgi:hypothetical protein